MRAADGIVKCATNTCKCKFTSATPVGNSAQVSSFVTYASVLLTSLFRPVFLSSPTCQPMIRRGRRLTPSPTHKQSTVYDLLYIAHSTHARQSIINTFISYNTSIFPSPVQLISHNLFGPYTAIMGCLLPLKLLHSMVCQIFISLVNAILV